MRWPVKVNSLNWKIQAMFQIYLKKNETQKVCLEQANVTLAVCCFQFHTAAEEVPVVSVQQDIAALLVLGVEEPDSFLVTELIRVCG